MRSELKKITILVCCSVIITNCGEAFFIAHSVNKENKSRLSEATTTGVQEAKETSEVKASPELRFRKCNDDTSLEEGQPIIRDEITLKRHSQWVKRYGCKDNKPSREVVESDGYEEVVSPNMSYSIPIQTVKEPYFLNDLWDKWDDEIEGKAYNRTTCSRDRSDIAKFLLLPPLLLAEKLLRGAEVGFRVDLASTLFNMRVVEGVNYIDYTFTDSCDSLNKGGECKSGRKVIEKGTLVLKVNYDLKEAGEIKEVKEVDKKPEDCLPKEKTKSSQN